MGLQKRQSVGKYVKLKDGKFYLSTDKENTEPFDELEGTLVDMYLKDEEFQGQPQRKLYVVMHDGDENLIVGFRIDSRYATSFLSFLKNVDLKKKFTLVPISKTEKNEAGEDVTKASMLVKQDGGWVKSYFTQKTPNGLPQMVKVKVNGKFVWDRGEQLEFYENMIENEIKPKLPKQATSTTIITDEPEVLAGEDEGDLPWEK